MGQIAEDIRSMDDLFVYTLRDIYRAENHINKSLPKMIHRAGNVDLRRELEIYLNATAMHIRTLEEVFEVLGTKPFGVQCPGVDGLLEEADRLVSENDNREVVDAALIAAVQAIGHYQIACYGTLSAWAKRLGKNDCLGHLQKGADEAKAVDETLTQLANSQVNLAAI